MNQCAYALRLLWLARPRLHVRLSPLPLRALCAPLRPTNGGWIVLDWSVDQNGYYTMTFNYHINMKSVVWVSLLQISLFK